MTSPLKDRLDALADDVVPVDLLDRTLRGSRRLAVRRRLAASGLVVALAAAITGVAVLVGSPTADRPTPVHPGPTPSLIAPTGSLALLGNHEIWLPRGPAIPLPASPAFTSAIQVPTGFVLESADAAYFLPTGSSVPKRIASGVEDVAAASDGSAVLTTTGGNSGVQAYALPSLTPLHHTTFASGTGPRLVAVNPDTALLAGFSGGGPGPNAAAVWNFRTGVLSAPTSERVQALDQSTDGRVLRSVEDRPRSGAKTGDRACVELVTAKHSIPEDSGGTCQAAFIDLSGGWVSPDGTVVVLTVDGVSGSNSYSLRASDLNAGAWRPTTLPELVTSVTWNADDTFQANVTVEGISGLPKITGPDGGSPVLIPRVGS